MRTLILKILACIFVVGLGFGFVAQAYTNLTVTTLDAGLADGVSASRFIADGGSVTSPAFTFTEDEDTGMYQTTANEINLSAGGGSSEILIYPSLIYTQYLRPFANNTYDLGVMGSNAWANIYASGTTYSAYFAASSTAAGTNPTITFANDPDTGFRNTGLNIIDIMGGGNPVLNLQPGNMYAYGNILTATTNVYDLGAGWRSWKDIYASGTAYIGGNVYATSGNATNPAYSFYGDTDTGFAITSGNNVDIVGNGATYMRVGTGGVIVFTTFTPSSNNARDVGTGQLSFRDVYASGTAYLASANVASLSFVPTTTPATSGLTASTTLPFSGSFVYVSSTAGASTVILSATSSIATSTVDGFQKTIVGTSDTNTVTIYDNSNVQLAGDATITLGIGDTLHLAWSALLGDWLEISRANN